MEGFDPILAWLNGLARVFALEPAMLPSVLGAAVLCRFLRASVEEVASGWMYAVIILIGIAAGITPWFGGTGMNPGAASLSFIAMTLLLQRGLQGASVFIEGSGLPKWIKVILPADNKFVKPPAEPPLGESKP